MLLALALLAGCAPEADSVDAGCLDALPAADVLGDEPTGFLERANCWRGYLGLPPLKPTRPAQAAVVAHRDWLVDRGEVHDRVAMLDEAVDSEGFTGATPYDREVASGSVETGTPEGSAAVWGWYVGDASESLDRQLDHPWLRDALLQPVIVGAGYAEGSIGGARRAYLDVVAAIPSGRRTARPVVFPKDGEEDVPTAWRDPFAGPLDPLFRDTAWGYPVSITVSAQELVPTGWNPFGVSVASASIRPEGGEPVELVTRIPAAGQGALPLHTTVVLVPDRPLQPDTVYEVTAELHAVDLHWSVATSFRTADVAEAAETDQPTQR
jgi:hypothetical protein